MAKVKVFMRALMHDGHLVCFVPADLQMKVLPEYQDIPLVKQECHLAAVYELNATIESLRTHAMEFMELARLRAIEIASLKAAKLCARDDVNILAERDAAIVEIKEKNDRIAKLEAALSGFQAGLSELVAKELAAVIVEIFKAAAP